MDNFQINNQEEKGIYLTAPNIISERNNELPDIFKETEQNDNKELKIKTKFKLPPIVKFRNSHKNTQSQSILERDSKTLKVHSYFSPENFLDFNPSCNKFSSKISPFLKESLSPEKIIYKRRIYDLDELKMLSDLKKDQIIKRSPGQGIFMRIQTYKHLNKRIPFQLVLSSLSAGKYNENNNNNDDDDLENNFKKDENNYKRENTENSIFSPKKNFKFNRRIRPKFHHLYKEKKFVPRRSSIMIKPNNDIIKTFKQPPKVAFDEMENNINLNKILDLDNKFRDKNILNALEKCGEDDMKYLIINN